MHRSNKPCYFNNKREITMSKFLHRLWEGMMPIVGMIIFVILFIVGIFIFSYLLIVAAVIVLILFIIAFIQVKVAQRKRPKNHPSGRIIEHNNDRKNKS
ncbi:hypothetical protein FIV31_06645 [Coxiella endosymbiont of Ornithodoros amblus]|uniref:hypothetical protein n=1 Tax=Coxiella endosymbiont of Ornithodoros amblus TaxID=1656166 RepID=UPI00244DCA5A|nr:hypothetical protein [Coxiella endosymbiont of Ornithodoros amblus]MBW5802979.1 hypothetical protein [Coxiella endosymbiont of Ornithodoros amblus]